MAGPVREQLVSRFAPDRTCNLMPVLSLNMILIGFEWGLLESRVLIGSCRRGWICATPQSASA